LAIGAGIGSTLQIASEGTPGTIATLTRALEYNTESLGQDKVPVQGLGLRGTGLFPRSSRRSVAGRNAGGDVNLDIATNGMGLLFQAMMGSSTSAVLTGSAYQQVHTPGSLNGISLTVQKNVPELVTGTRKPFTYNGCKVISWTINFTKDGIPTLTLTLDAWDETTATAEGSGAYIAGAGVFSFNGASLTVGGTVTTTSGLASVSGGSPVPIAGVTGGSITGTTGIRAGSDNRYINGKIEQGQADWRSVTGTINLDFVNRSDVYDLFNADTGAALKLSFVTSVAITGSTYPTFEVLLPKIFFTGETPKVGGPGIISLSPNFEATDDGTNAACQLRYVTSDTAF
jgi:hypothetical protein